MLRMFLYILTSHKDVIKVDNDTRNSLQEIFHYPLKNGGSGRNSKRKAGVLIQPLVCVDGNKRLRVISQLQLLVCMT